MNTEPPAADSAAPTAQKPRRAVPLVIAVATLALLVAGGLMVVHAEAQTNKVALSQSPKPVAVVEAVATTFRSSRTYVGTLAPWVEAKIGPQLVSSYVDTVLVRPGAVVKRGEVLATLDCRNAGATSQAVAMQARALEAQQEAAAHEATRIQGLLSGGFVSPNEVEQKTAQSSAQQAELLATQAKLLGASLEVGDCVLRAPFDAEVATRTIDPGAFVRPGMSIVSIVDRSTVRIVADAPEVDFSVVAPGTQVAVHVLATNRELVATIARRAPAADLATRTVHFEMDVADPERELPVGTTAELRIEVGQPMPAVEIPLYAATVRGEKASVFVVDDGVAHKRSYSVRGERQGNLYLDSELPPGSKVVSEGRALLSDGDRVTASPDPAAQGLAARGNKP
ncbi:MAG TPA: efflux RND transporter periplasmic adaptor subunit [Polyangiaceae bacterium]